jgi:hypothetical protein
MLKGLKHIASLSLLLLLLAGKMANAQSGTNNDLVSRLRDYCTRMPYEEMYIHTDRDVYVAGEELWFTSYLFERETGKISSGSEIAYFELLNPNNKPVIQKRMLISEGICPGSTHLPDTLPPGIYTCRIYTNWMKNFLPANASTKNIAIVNPFRNSTFTGKTLYGEHLRPGVNVRFSPEGGRLLNGLPAKVAVMVTDEYQRGMPFNGIVRNSRGDSVASFTAGRHGLGSFELTPVSGNSFYVLHEGDVTYLPLPDDEGVALTADYIGKDIITITLTENGSSYSSDRQEYTLLVQSEGNVGYVDKFRIPGYSKSVIITKMGLPGGVNQITLFNENLKPVCERFIYIGKSEEQDKLNLDIPDIYQRREKVTVTVDEPLKISDLSISVIPRSYSVSGSGIKDFLDFGTEFGYLPWRNSNDLPDATDIDDFLISAESSWINWNEVLNEKQVPLNFVREKDMHFIEGIIKERGSSTVKKEQTLTMSIPGKTASFYHAHTGADGHFKFMMPVDNIQRNLIIQPLTEEEDFSLEILPPYSEKLPLSVSYNDSVSAAVSKLFSDLGARYQLNMIFGKSSRQESQPETAPVEKVKRFYGKPEVELIMSDYIKLPVMQEVFFELTPGVRLRERRSGFEMRIVNPFSGTYYDDPPTVLIDGVVITDMSVLAGIDPEVVEKIDILKTPYLTGDYTHNGIVHVITIPGKFNNITLPDYAVRLPYRVTEPVPLFSAADYTDPLRKQSRIPDFRNTLYWNPSVKPDSEGRIILEFWTSDLAGEYLIDIQGITTDGSPATIKRLITVK